MTYVDGYVIPMPKKNIASYRKMAEMGGKLWMKHGALQYFECIADDATPKGVVMTFPKLVRVKTGETVVFSFVLYKSKAHRDAVNKKVMADPYMNDPKNMPHKMPFDMKRMSYGGFKAMVER